MQGSTPKGLVCSTTRIRCDAITPPYRHNDRDPTPFGLQSPFSYEIDKRTGQRGMEYSVSFFPASFFFCLVFPPFFIIGLGQRRRRSNRLVGSPLEVFWSPRQTGFIVSACTRACRCPEIARQRATLRRACFFPFFLFSFSFFLFFYTLQTCAKNKRHCTRVQKGKGKKSRIEEKILIRATKKREGRKREGA